MADWEVDNLVSSLTSDTTKQDELRKALEEAMEQEINHEMKFSDKKSNIKFVRSTAMTRNIGHNFNVMKSLQMATEKGTSQEPFQNIPSYLYLVTQSWPTPSTRKKRETNSQPFHDKCKELNGILANQSECGSSAACDGSKPYRTISGCCNNIVGKFWGSSNRAFQRFVDSAYADNTSLPRGGMATSNLPSARDVSSAVHRLPQKDGQKNASLMVMQFAQFLDHDLTLTPERGLLNILSNTF